jgi:anti-sigma factor RsiW
MREEFMEAALGTPPVISPKLQEHLESCPACATELTSLRRTMTLLEEWQTPEPSPYFNTRLRARLREQAAAPAASWLAWLRRPVMAGVAAVLIALGVGMLEVGRFSSDSNTLANNDNVLRVSTPGSAVGDLQYLDNNADLFAEFAPLDGQSATE